MPNPSVAVVIPCLPRDVQYLPRALKSVAQQEGISPIVVTRVADERLSAALNKLIASTTAEYIIRLDADDELMPWAVRHLVDIAEHWPNAAIIYATQYYESASPFDAVEVKRIDKAAPLGCSNIMRRSAWQRVGGYDEDLEHLEQVDLVRRLEKVFGAPVAVDALVYRYHRRPGSMSTDAAGIEKAIWQLRDKEQLTTDARKETQ